MPLEFAHDASDAKDAYKLVMAYDGSGRRVSKTRMKKTAFDGPWYADLVTHYTGIGTEIRENMPGGTLKDVRVVVNMPNGLGRYGGKTPRTRSGVSPLMKTGSRPPGAP